MILATASPLALRQAEFESFKLRTFGVANTLLSAFKLSPAPSSMSMSLARVKTSRCSRRLAQITGLDKTYKLANVRLCTVSHGGFLVRRGIVKSTCFSAC